MTIKLYERELLKSAKRMFNEGNQSWILQKNNNPKPRLQAVKKGKHWVSA